MPKRKARKPVPVVRLKSSRYNPTKAELNEEVRIPTTPQRLAKAVVRDVKSNTRIDR